MSELPPPMTPADCDLRGLEYMPLHGAKLFASDFYARASDAEFRAGMSLWWEAWQQVPAASLPDDDVVLCRLADLARDIKTWRKIKAMAMHGFVLCSDGRWYHEFLAQQALVAWDKRVKERERKAQWREKRQGRDADVPRDKTGTRHGTGRGRDADVPADGNRRDGTVIEEEGSVASATGSAAAPPPSAEPCLVDPEKLMFDGGIALLGAAGTPERQARSLLGKWRRDWGTEAVIVAIGTAKREGAIAPIEFITKALETRNGKRGMEGHNGTNGAGPYRRSVGRELLADAERQWLAEQGANGSA